MNAIIVDDEEYSRQSLFFLINGYCPDVKVRGIARSVAEARSLLKSEQIDVVFLDIAMPVEDGFSLLPDLQRNITSVIFTTAYNQYAIKAIRASAVDYLLKPIDIQELQDSIGKAADWKSRTSDNDLLAASHETVFSSLNENLNEIKKIKKLNLPHSNGFHVLNISNILYIKADSNYSIFHIDKGEKIVVSKHLKEYESILEDCEFCRIHKSTMINLSHLQSYSNKNGLVVKMSDGTEHSVSRRRSPGFMDTVKDMFKK
ncbi:LytR/AlgR family response regulator transcription factor [Daejeonella lutea]|uniref:Two component transcriptional regulator, LytTR family n=1 Tax=Daejeonella lutea TaxID=572036 RepID=A0A1T5B720_9SPHI|nr:LytTR family DNA-binding domain-containing protein [Daejeonella lutea]SKB43071.1 two component transcriptional regulator, LytTR family [Daejeonella lutea]